MKIKRALGLCTALILLAGCVSRPAVPEPTASPAPELTATPEPTPGPTPTPEPTPSPTPEPAFRLARGDEEREYTLFTGTSVGAGALRTWLLGEGAEKIAGFIPERVIEPPFSLVNAPVTGDIPSASDETRRIRLATDRMVLESGLLEAVLPGFESRCGYVVEVFTGDRKALSGWADSASADAVLLPGESAAAVKKKGFAEITPLFTTPFYLIEGNQNETSDITGATPEGGKP